MSAAPGFAFAVIGINHGHIYGQVQTMLDAGCRLTSFFAVEDDLAAEFARKYPHAARVSDENAILEDDTVKLVLGAGILSERAPMAVRAMRHGKDVMLDKPGCTTLAQLRKLRRAQAETGRIVSILYSEHYTQRSTVAAGDLVRAGAIGRVVHTAGFGPHRLGDKRPDWFWQRDTYGGILIDIASHQVEQFLFFTASTEARVLSSQVANFDHPQRKEFDDFGQMLLASDHATGYLRVDWLTPDGSPVWGDSRLFLLGTEGVIELRKNADIEGRAGGDHLFLTDRAGTRYMDCSTTPITYGEQLRDDVMNRTETAMPQAHCFYAMELALTAQANAERLAGARPTRAVL